MTRTYSAADFANARFAEHESGLRAVRTHNPIVPWIVEMVNGPAHSAKNSEMADMGGWVPVFPARTIHDRDVEALCADTASYERDDYLDGFIRGFQQAGGVAKAAVWQMWVRSMGQELLWVRCGSDL